MPSCQLHGDVHPAIIVVRVGVKPNSIPPAVFHKDLESVSCRLNGAHRMLGVKPHCGHVGAVEDSLRSEGFVVALVCRDWSSALRARFELAVLLVT